MSSLCMLLVLTQRPKVKIGERTGSTLGTTRDFQKFPAVCAVAWTCDWMRVLGDLQVSLFCAISLKPCTWKLDNPVVGTKFSTAVDLVPTVKIQKYK